MSICDVKRCCSKFLFIFCILINHVDVRVDLLIYIALILATIKYHHILIIKHRLFLMYLNFFTINNYSIDFFLISVLNRWWLLEFTLVFLNFCYFVSKDILLNVNVFNNWAIILVNECSIILYPLFLQLLFDSCLLLHDFHDVSNLFFC